jgi:formylmethanofuran dehydrogenase subunit E
MNYARFRQQGDFIGSGTVESAGKQIAALRLKRAGARCALVISAQSEPSITAIMFYSEKSSGAGGSLTAATGCSVGHRTMRIEDYGKVAAVFVDVVTGKAVRIASALDVRQKAYAYALSKSRRYFAQMQA